MNIPNSKLPVITLMLALLSCNGKSANVKSSDAVLSPTKKEDFVSFYKRFITDSAFQIERVRFPLKGSFMDGEVAGGKEAINEDSNYVWTAENWTLIKSTNNSDLSDFYVTETKTDSMVIKKMEGKDFGFVFEERYKLINNKWYLIYLKDWDM